MGLHASLVLCCSAVFWIDLFAAAAGNGWWVVVFQQALLKVSCIAKWLWSQSDPTWRFELLQQPLG